MRLSVIVIPRFDAESRKHWECPMIQVAYNGFRVEARNDNYREPRLKIDEQSVIIQCSLRGTESCC